MLRALVLVSTLASAHGCAQKEPPKSVAAPTKPPELAAPADVTAESYQPPALPEGKVMLKDAFGGAHVVDVEIAATEPARTRGLMWRKELANGKGMLFIFPREAIQSFWMRNTLIPLDMIFITKDQRIAGIVENTNPMSLQSRSVQVASVFVLEVPAGWSSKVGITAGGTVELHGTASVTVE
ncbi:MAG: DUF192 domain-containing protein [Myxococcaceae bacterium]